MHLRSLFGAVAVLTTTTLAACANEPADREDEVRTVVFDGQDVATALAQSPDRVFEVDLDEDGVAYVFDQRERLIDLDSFVATLPSGEAPLPLVEVTDQLGLPTDAPRFVLQRDPDEDAEFRKCGWICGQHPWNPFDDDACEWPFPEDGEMWCSVCLPVCDPIIF